MALHPKRHLERDLLVLSISIVATVALEYFGIFDWLFFTLSEYAIPAALVAGFFCTSLFTITPATAALAELSNFTPLLPLSLTAATGAVIGDLVLFLFVRDVISEDIALFINRSWKRKLASIFHYPFLQWIVPVAGAFVIASPLPDELGLAMMGISKTRLSVMVPISFAMNFLGISAIWFAANAI